MTNSDVTVKILRAIRDEIRHTNQRLDQTNQRLDQTNHRLGAVEGALRDLAQQQRFVVRYVKAIAERDSRLDADFADLRDRVEALEKENAAKRR